MKLAAFLVALLWSACASAQLMLVGVSKDTTYVGPGTIAAHTAWWGLRAYDATKCTGSVAAVRLRRSADNAEADIPIGTDCRLSASAVTAHCTSSCFVRTLYDQVSATGCGGASCNLVQTTAGNQPPFVLNCFGTNVPCMTSTSTAITLASANNATPATGVQSISSVHMKDTGVGNICSSFIRTNGLTGNRMNHNTGGAAVLAGGTSGTITSSNFVVASPMATAAVLNGASSVENVNGVETTGTTTGSTTAGAPGAVRSSAGANVCSFFAGGFRDNVAWSAGERANLVANAQGFWR